MTPPHPDDARPSDDRPDGLHTGDLRTGNLRPADLRGLATLLGSPEPDTIVPLCWHWVLLLNPVDPINLDEDGYTIGSPITPNPGMTRMFAGGRVRTMAPLSLNRETTRTTKVSSVIDKQGRRGPLRFVTMRSTWNQDGQDCLIDDQDYVFVPDSSPAPSPEGAGQTDGDGFLVTEPLLVTFSALTANPYRIHWDRDFCRRHGHDGLVVHGPLQALLMAQALENKVKDVVGKEFSYRFRAPATAPTRLSMDGGGTQVRRPDGTVTATSTLTEF
ncbi:MaoC/PaaZ C-terminal domain-containing protein [Cutibacterium sp.]|uniref:MaoC/PaaZ C-terminal domain-containing protein n=1 Tax=Cutibacterium sp. TaxID=1912221 RepID=UPI0026DBD622|nr:MaoC/PaaZ C-terminal domain-containing protein [Cutibacterium sp.]MDO4412428.1 MaoC/PaaZ C-terminal domain-containing protein [Cutibacterium sp.]